MLGAFLDDAGTHSNSGLVVVGGLLGTEEQWDLFEPRWTELLNHPVPGKPPLTHFHLSECRARRGQFYEYTEAEANAITHDFRRVIVDIGFVTIASAVNETAWNELVVGAFREAFGEPLGYCFSKCIELVISTIRLRKPGEQVSIFIDQATRPKLGSWADLFKHLSESIYPELKQFGFPPVKDVVALQGADMIATETYQYGHKWLKEQGEAQPNPHFREFMQRELSAGLILDREHIQEALSLFQAASASGAQPS